MFTTKQARECTAQGKENYMNSLMPYVEKWFFKCEKEIQKACNRGYDYCNVRRPFRWFGWFTSTRFNVTTMQLLCNLLEKHDTDLSVKPQHYWEAGMHYCHQITNYHVVHINWRKK